MSKRYGHSRLVNTFGALGYMSVLIQWAWTLIVVFYPFIIDGKFIPTLPVNTVETLPVPEINFPQPIAVILSSITVVGILIVTVVTIVRMPRTLGKSGAQITQTISKKTSDFAVTHHYAPKKDRQRLSHRVVIVLKALAVAVPIVVLTAPHPATPLAYSVVVTIALFCGLVSGAYFALQYLTAHLSKVDPRTVW